MNTIVPSPRRLLEEHFGYRPTASRTRMADATCPFGCGELVVARDDPRHVGEVLRTISGFVHVKWLDTGWRSEIYFAKLMRASEAGHG